MVMQYVHRFDCYTGSKRVDLFVRATAIDSVMPHYGNKHMSWIRITGCETLVKGRAEDIVAWMNKYSPHLDEK